MKIAGNNTVLRLVSGGYKSAYSNEVELQSRVCIDNNQLQINAKTKELILDCRKKKTDITLHYFLSLAVYIEEVLNQDTEEEDHHSDYWCPPTGGT